MNKEELKAFFSEYWDMPVSDITDTLVLHSHHTTLKNFNSVRFYQFFAAVESNFNVRFEDITNITTFGQLWKEVKA